MCPERTCNCNRGKNNCNCHTSCCKGLVWRGSAHCLEGRTRQRGIGAPRKRCEAKVCGARKKSRRRFCSCGEPTSAEHKCAQETRSRIEVLFSFPSPARHTRTTFASGRPALHDRRGIMGSTRLRGEQVLAPIFDHDVASQRSSKRLAKHIAHMGSGSESSSLAREEVGLQSLSLFLSLSQHELRLRLMVANLLCPILFSSRRDAEGSTNRIEK